MAEEQVQQNQEQNEGNQETSEGEQDYKALYLSEIDNAKKQRKAKQEAESKLNKFEQDAEALRVGSLKEEGKKDEYIKELEGKISTISPKLETLEGFYNNTKTELLSKVADETERETLSGLSLEQLQVIIPKMTAQKKAEQIGDSYGAVKQNKIKKDISEMTIDEQKENWDAIVDSFR